MATRARIAIKLLNGTYRSVYHHWDGYPRGLGMKLARYWTDPELVHQAINEGDASSWGIDLHNCEFFQDRGEKDTDPRTHANKQELLKEAFQRGEEYLYIYNKKMCTWHLILPQEPSLMIRITEQSIEDIRY